MWNLVTSIVPSDYLKPNSSIEINLKVSVYSDDDGQKCSVLARSFDESKMKECVRVFDSFHDLLSTCLCVYRVLTGWGRTPRWDLTACGGKTGTTMKRSKEMHLDPVCPNVLRDVHIYSSDTQCSVIHKIHIYAHNHIPLWVLLLLQQRFKSVLECSLCCCICYKNHQLSFIFCSGKLALIQTV